VAQAAAAYTTGIWNSEQSIERGRIEMTGVLRKLGLLVLTTLICTASADAELPGAKVSGQIVYTVVGPVDHPYLVLHLSTQYFDIAASSNTLLAVLTPQHYKLVSGFTKILMTRPVCTRSRPSASAWYSVGIEVDDQDRVQKCVLPQSKGCDYFAALLRLPGIIWTAQDLLLIQGFASEVQCKRFPFQ
jgi:hypothetical protein